jgi:hypothetical protein
MYRELIGQLES